MSAAMGAAHNGVPGSVLTINLEVRRRQCPWLPAVVAQECLFSAAVDTSGSDAGLSIAEPAILTSLSSFDYRVASYRTAYLM
jgi:hypothetical protein